MTDSLYIIISNLADYLSFYEKVFNHNAGLNSLIYWNAYRCSYIL